MTSKEAQGTPPPAACQGAGTQKHQKAHGRLQGGAPKKHVMGSLLDVHGISWDFMGLMADLC